MELLTIEHKDFTMIVECTKFDDIWNKAKSNVGEDKLYSTYSWSEGVVSVRRTMESNHEIDMEQGVPAPATFFDNADYPIWIEFKDYVKDAQFGSILQNDNDRFSFRRHILAGFINYKNEIGRSEIQIIYKVDKETRTFRFGFEVLSTKLDYHEHWCAIVEDIATLYEIWCFIEVSHIVKDQLRLQDEDVEHRNRLEMNGVFSWELGKGEHSRILFRKDGVELAELVYNPKNADKENNNVGMKDLVVPTVPQKPDIVLQLTKNDLQQGMKMTYLFDAKYRIDGKDKGVDVPPEDAINQMHRYRDAIYYKDYDANALKKEVIGGYILFPGDGEPNDVAVSKFYKTIKEVNIGAFPLRPKDVENRKLLEKFIDELIHTKSSETIAHVIPQKGAYVEVGNRVLIGLVKEDNRLFQAFMDGTATLYYSGKQFPTTIALQDLHFFMPYIKGLGVRDVYEIVKVRTITGKEAKQTEEDEADSKALRLAFELRYVRKQYAILQPIDTTKMIGYTFIDTTFDKLDECVIIDKL